MQKAGKSCPGGPEKMSPSTEAKPQCYHCCLRQGLIWPPLSLIPDPLKCVPPWLAKLLTLKFRVGTCYLSVQFGGPSLAVALIFLTKGGGACVGGVLELVIG